MAGGSIELALARAQDAQDAAEEAEAEARGWGRLRGRGGPPAGPQAAPSGSGSGGGPGGPPKGAAESGPRSGAVDALYQGSLTGVKYDVQALADRHAARDVAIDLTPSEHLSRTIEERRRERLASERARWENRLVERARECAWYRHRACEIVDTMEACEAAGLVGRQLPADELTGWPLWAALHDAGAQLERCERRRRYAANRVKSLSTDLGPRVAACEMESRWIRCECDARAPRPIAKGCAQRAACSRCRKRAAAQARRRALPAIKGHMHERRDGRGRLGRVRMITIHGRHSGDVAKDREALIRGWMGLRKQLHRWWGYAVPFLLQFEVTAGADGKGHVHAHVIVVGGPAFWNYAAIQRTWRSVMRTSTHLDIQLARSAEGAAMYVAKYATKGAIIGGGWSDELTADVIAMHYGKRSITTSQRFWLPRVPICACCGAWVERCEPPDALTRQLGPAPPKAGADPPESGANQGDTPA